MIFNLNKNINKYICHSGGAKGSDSIFEQLCIQYNIEVKAYSYKTPEHTSINKIEITEDEYQEGIDMIKNANKIMRRYGIEKYYNLLARNWMQIKPSESVYAVGSIVQPNKKNKKGYYNKSQYEQIDGGTGYAVQMAIIKKIPVYVLNQIDNNWYRWSYILNKYVRYDLNKIDVSNFTGIGTREINENSIIKLKELFSNTFNMADHKI